ncbi:uncharacterized protein LOC113761706 [Coffea eugenioides]|uniref:Uncharacterized protein n=1 Tax=Coffea arabica TaxID=13443 RepID=A0ABM4VLM0_COFAR|nr:uncharacterized protein LOC113716253 [Coffea arabica]XP_027160611.1 uncharacterized protein LOC113761706 [Coffea eugenioides]
METLVVVAQHRNQYYSRSKGHGPEPFGSFDSPPSKDFRGINCRTFQSGSGLLPTPIKSFSSPVPKRVFSPSFSPKTPSALLHSRSEEPKKSKKLAKSSSAIPIPMKLKVDVDYSRLASSFSGEFNFSERWAGPAYSNSPPPSSLPIPKFSLRPKRTVSLDLPSSSASDIDFRPIAKSAPASPTRERSPSPDDLFHDGVSLSVDSATKTLRRILNLDLTDD